jgi:hypothetical protein
MISSAGPAASPSPDSGRTAHFNAGMTGTKDVASSMNQPAKSDAYTTMGFHPASVLDASQISGYHPGNGNSAADAARQTPAGQIADQNGSSASTWGALNPSFQTRLAA